MSKLCFYCKSPAWACRIKPTLNTTRRNHLLALCQRAKIIGLTAFILGLPISIAAMQAALALFGLAYVVEAALTKSFRFPATPINRPLFTYIAVTIVVSFFSLSFLKNVNEFRSICVKIAAFYLVTLFLQERAQVKRCVKLLLLGVSVAAVYGVMQYYLEVELLRPGKPLILLRHVENDSNLPVRINGFNSYMTFSEQLAMTLLILLALWFAVKTTSQRAILSIVGLLIFFALLWTYTRSAWVGAACGLLLFGYLRARKFVIVLLPLLALGLLNPDLQDRLFSIFQAEENLERLYTWESTLRIIRDHPLVGIGKGGNFSKVIGAYRESRYPGFDFTSRAHAHNNILQVTAEGGVLSLLSFLWLWAVMFHALYRAYRQIPATQPLFEWLALGCLCAIVAFFVQGFFEHNWSDAESVTMMWFILALALKLPSLQECKDSSLRSEMQK